MFCINNVEMDDVDNDGDVLMKCSSLLHSAMDWEVPHYASVEHVPFPGSGEVANNNEATQAFHVAPPPAFPFPPPPAFPVTPPPAFPAPPLSPMSLAMAPSSPTTSAASLQSTPAPRWSPLTLATSTTSSTSTATEETVSTSTGTASADHRDAEETDDDDFDDADLENHHLSPRWSLLVPNWQIG